jgi:hypothetical protein
VVAVWMAGTGKREGARVRRGTAQRRGIDRQRPGCGVRRQRGVARRAAGRTGEGRRG